MQVRLASLCVLLLFGYSLPPQLRGLIAQTGAEHYSFLLQSANAYLETRQYAEAKAALQAAVALEPQRAEGWTQLGLLCDRINDFKSAEVAFRRSVQLQPKGARAHYLLGLTLIANPREGLDWPAAILEFRQAMLLEPTDIDAMDRLGAGLLATGQTDEAVAVLQHAVTVAPERAEPHFDLGLAFQARGDLRAAADHYRLTLKAKPAYSEADSALGKVLLMQGQLPEAESRLREALRLNPDLQDAHYALGGVLRKQKRTAEAQQEFDEAVALDQRLPNGIAASQLSNGALAKAAKGDLAGAEADLRKAIVLRPDYGVPHNNLGLILADERHMQEAARQLSLAISLMPGRAQPWVDLARVQGLLGDLPGARKSIAFALQLAPENQSAQREARIISSSNSDGPPTPTRQAELLPVTQDTAARHADFASALEAERDWVDATAEWLHVLMLEPAAEAPRLALAQCLQQQGDGAGAILEERKALLVDPKSLRAHVALAESLIATGFLKEAAEELNVSLTLDPGSTAVKTDLERLGKQ